jgi:hypothetical protein
MFLIHTGKFRFNTKLRSLWLHAIFKIYINYDIKSIVRNAKNLLLLLD